MLSNLGKEFYESGLFSQLEELVLKVYGVFESLSDELKKLGLIMENGDINCAVMEELLDSEDFDRWASAFYKGPKAPPLEHVISAIDVYDMATAETERTMIDKILCTHCEYGTIVERDTLFDEKSQTYQTGLFVECKGKLIGPNLSRMGLNTALMPLCTRCPYFKKN